MSILTRLSRSPTRALWLLTAVLATALGLLNAGPMVAAMATFDGASSGYAITSQLSMPNSATTHAQSSPAASRPASWASSVPVGGFSVAAESAPEGVAVFRTPRLGAGGSELENGLDPAKFAAGDQSAYVGDEAAARSLADPKVGSYENGYTRFDMHRDFEGEFAKFKFNYPEGGPGSFEYQIPQSLIPRFNELTVNRSWVPFQ